METTFTAEIRAKCTSQMKKALDQLARERQGGSAQIIRQAVDEFLRRQLKGYEDSQTDIHSNPLMDDRHEN